MNDRFVTDISSIAEQCFSVSFVNAPVYAMCISVKIMPLSFALASSSLIKKYFYIYNKFENVFTLVEKIEDIYDLMS